MSIFKGIEEFHNILNSWLLAYGSITYILVIIVIIKFRESSFRSTFYLIAISLAMIDFLGILLKIVDPIMLAILKPDPIWPKIFGYWTHSVWYGVELSQLLIALERFTAVWIPVYAESKIFTKRNTLILIGIVWVLSFGGNVIMFSDRFSWYYNPVAIYSYNFSYPEAQILNKMRDLLMQSIIYALIAFVYFLAGVKLHFMGRNRSGPDARSHYSIKLEKALYWQGFLVTTPQALGVLFYHILIYCPWAPKYLVTVTITCNYLYNTINPAIYLCFNSVLREKMMEFYCKNYRKIPVHRGGDHQMSPLLTSTSSPRGTGTRNSSTALNEHCVKK